jgi:hypothetical protein
MKAKDIALGILSEGDDRPLRDMKPNEAEKHVRPTTLPMSDHRHVEDGDMHRVQELHDRLGTKGKVQNVHPQNLRASQDWIDKRWHPSRPDQSEDHEDHEEPLGFRFHDDHPDHVHLFNGHHRAEQALKDGKPLKMRVISHTRRHDDKMDREDY